MIKKHYSNFLFIIPLLLLACISIPNVSIPYFWDEAWSYFPAIKKMSIEGSSLLPGAIPLGTGKGHPQLFLFITSLWMNLTTGSIVEMRLLSLLISASLLLTVYFGLKRIFSQETALIAAILISVQSIFLAQSILLLPEMLLTFFLVLSLFFFYKKKYGLYAITSTAMVLTKETSIIFAMVFGVFFLIDLIQKEKRNEFKWLNLLYMLLPAILYGFFLVLHYIEFGVFFYSEHLNHLNYSLNSIIGKLSKALGTIFISRGIIFVTLSYIISTIVLIIKGKKSTIRFTLLALTLVLTFSIFSAFNFYTTRYMLAPLVLVLMSYAAILYEVQMKEIPKYIVSISIAVICFSYSIYDKNNSDADLGYVEVINLHKEMVHYCEENNFYDEHLAVSFNMLFALRNTDLGYRSNDEAFPVLTDWRQHKGSKYFIYESTHGCSKEVIEHINKNYQLIKSFKDKHAWGYIYKNVKHKGQND